MELLLLHSDACIVQIRVRNLCIVKRGWWHPDWRGIGRKIERVNIWLEMEYWFEELLPIPTFSWFVNVSIVWLIYNFIIFIIQYELGWCVERFSTVNCWFYDLYDQLIQYCHASIPLLTYVFVRFSELVAPVRRTMLSKFGFLSDLRNWYDMNFTTSTC